MLFRLYIINIAMSTLKKSLALSLLISLAIFAATPLAQWYYWDSGLSSIEPTIVRSQEDSNLLVTIFIFTIIIWLKFFLYDLIGRSVIHQLKKRWVTILFFTVYAFGVLIDMYASFLSVKPVVDSGFASFAIVTYTPAILFTGLVVLLITRFWYYAKTADK